MIILKKVLAHFNYLDRYITGVLCIVITVLCFAQFLCRELNITMSWGEETVNCLIVWMIYMGASYCTYDDSHMRVDILYDRLPRKGQVILNLINHLIWLVFSAVVIYSVHPMVLMYAKKKVVSIMAHIPMWFTFFSADLGMIFMIIRILQRIITHDIPDIRSAFSKGVK